MCACTEFRLFSLYGEIIVRGFASYEGIKVGGKNLNNIRYANDTVLLVENEKELQDMFNEVNRSSEQKGLNINAAKTNVMILSKCHQIPKAGIRCDNKIIDQVESFKYLGSTVTCDVKWKTEVRRRIEIAKTASILRKRILTNRKLSLKTRKRSRKSNIKSTLLFGAETWTMSKNITQKLEAVEMWLWRRMLKIPWTDKKSNIKVMRMAGERDA